MQQHQLRLESAETTSHGCKVPSNRQQAEFESLFEIHAMLFTSSSATVPWSADFWTNRTSPGWQPMATRGRVHHECRHGVQPCSTHCQGLIGPCRFPPETRPGRSGMTAPVANEMMGGSPVLSRCQGPGYDATLDIAGGLTGESFRGPSSPTAWGWRKHRNPCRPRPRPLNRFQARKIPTRRLQTGWRIAVPGRCRRSCGPCLSCPSGRSCPWAP